MSYGRLPSCVVIAFSRHKVWVALKTQISPHNIILYNNIRRVSLAKHHNYKNILLQRLNLYNME